MVLNYIHLKTLALGYMYVSYGTAKSGVGISAMSVLRPDLMMKCVVPVIMAGIIAVRYLLPCQEYCLLIHKQIYGLVVSVLIAGDCT